MSIIIANNIYPEKLEPGKGNTDKLEASLLDLDIEIRDGKCKLASLIKEVHFLFPFSECHTSQTVPLWHIFFPIGAESSRIARASNNPHSFSTEIKTLTAHMSREAGGSPMKK